MLRNFNNVGFKTEIYREASNVLTPKYGHVVIFVVFWDPFSTGITKMEISIKKFIIFLKM